MLNEAGVTGFLREHLEAGLKDQLVKVGIVTQRGQIMIMLGPNPQCGLKVQCTLKRLQSEVNRAEPCTSCGKAVVNMRSFRLTLQCSFKHFLRSDIFAAIKFDDTSVV
jgi:hypothetical protein